MKRRIGILFLVFAVGVVCLGSQKAQTKENAIRIGALYTKTGFLAEHGRQADMGIKMALEEINTKGGILGRKIEVIWRDDQSKAEAASRESYALLFDKKVDVFLGSIISSTCGAASAIAKEQKIPFICAGSMTRSLTE